jgi:flagellar biosynthesis protein FlhF
MSEALAKVKRDLGRQAIILHTRTLRKGGFIGIGGRTIVEITATSDVNVLHPALSRGIIRPAAVAGGHVRQAEGTALHVAETEASQERARQPDKGLREEISQIRALVQTMLRESRSCRAPVIPEALMADYLALIQAEVADELARELVTRISDDLRGSPPADRQIVRKRLCEYIASMVPAAGPIVAKRDGRPRVVAMIGPTGVGKTTTIAKLAAHFKLRENQNVGLITIDTYRIAAVDQLRVYAQIIDVPLEVVMTPAELAEALSRLGGCDLVLIDTAGRGQNDALRLDELKRFLDVARPDETHLVLASNCNQAFLLQTVERFSAVGADHVVFTKLDEAIGFGTVLNVIRRIDKKLSYITTGQDVPDDIEVAHGRRIAELILGSAAGARDGVGGQLRGVARASDPPKAVNCLPVETRNAAGTRASSWRSEAAVACPRHPPGLSRTPQDGQVGGTDGDRP